MEQLRLFDREPSPQKRSQRRTPKAVRGQFEPIEPPDLAQESALWLTGQRSIAAQRGRRYVSASVRHPGKMQPDVAGAIIDTYTQPGDWIVDCMGGIGTTGVEGAERGRNVICLELVRHWANVAYANALRTAYRGSPGLMQVINGDARRLPQLLAKVPDVAIMSPPYGEALEPRSGRIENRIERIQALTAAGVLDPTQHNTWAGKVHRRGALIKSEGGGMASWAPQYDADAERPGADAVITSPVYGESRIAAVPGQQVFGSDTRADVANLPRGYDAALLSPPYGDTPLNPGLTHSLHFGRDPGDVERKRAREGHTQRGYDAALFSPPYADAISQSPSASDTEARQRRLEAAGIEGYKFGPNSAQAQAPRYDAAVMSPPYGPAAEESARGLKVPDAAPGEWSAYEDGQGPSPGWRGYGQRAYTTANHDAARADAVVASPPYGEAMPENGGHVGGEWGYNKAMKSMAQGYTTGAANIGNLRYGSMDKALALVDRLLKGETIPEAEWPGMQYLESMALIYRNCWLILKPGGLCILVLKDYRRNRRRVNLVGDTIRLMEAVGFVLHDRALALTSKVEDGKVISKVSPFVKVNARHPEKTGGKVLLPAGEEVLVFRKE